MNGKRFSKVDYRLDRAERHPDGYLQGVVPVTRPGVFPYRNDDGSLRYEFRPPEEVHHPESLKSLQLCPAQVEHVAMLDAGNIDQYKVGHLGDAVKVRPDGVVETAIRIDSPRGLQAYEDGVRGLSMGYNLDLEDAPPGSNWNGKPYTHIQRNIRYNHIAITKLGRLGKDLRLDSADAVEVDSLHEQEINSMTIRKVRIDSVEYEAPAQVAVFLEKETGRADTAEAKIATDAAAHATAMTAEKAAHATTAGKLAAADADLVKARKDLVDLEAAIPAKAAAIAKDRADALEVARAILPAAEHAKFDAMDAAALRVAVVKTKYPTVALDGASVEFVGGLFTSVKAGIVATGTNALAANRADSAANAAGAPAGGAANAGQPINLDAKRDEMIARRKASFDSVGKPAAAK